ncbi:MAG: hypothetical protein ACXW2E_01255 [Nitrososphaeraceae archaeon]
MADINPSHVVCYYNNKEIINEIAAELDCTNAADVFGDRSISIMTSPCEVHPYYNNILDQK